MRPWKASSLVTRGARGGGAATALCSFSRCASCAASSIFTVLRLTPVARAMARRLMPWRDSVTTRWSKSSRLDQDRVPLMPRSPRTVGAPDSAVW